MMIYVNVVVESLSLLNLQLRDVGYNVLNVKEYFIINGEVKD